MDFAQASEIVASRSYWHHSFEIYPGVTTRGNYDPLFMWDMLSLPSDLRGVRALDIGPSDGFFSMKLAQSGADVTAVDYKKKNSHGSGLMENITGLNFDYYESNLYDIPSLKLGKFDLVLCLGVLYHLPDMMKAVTIIKDLCVSRALIDTEYEPNLTPGVACARYYEARSLNNDPTNFWAPNQECLSAMLSDTGFSISRQLNWGRRILVDVEAKNKNTTLKTRFGYELFDDDWEQNENR